MSESRNVSLSSSSSAEELLQSPIVQANPDLLKLKNRLMVTMKATWDIQLRAAFARSLAPSEVLWKWLGMEDHFNTYIRTLNVYSDLPVNGNNSDAQNNLSWYYKLMTVNGQGTAPTVFADVCIGIGLLFPITGMIREVHNHYRTRRVNFSADYLKTRLSEIGYADEGIVYDQKKFINHFNAACLKFLERGKVIHKQQRVYKDGDRQKTYLNTAYKVDEVDKFLGLFSGRVNLNEKNILFDLLGNNNNYYIDEEENRKWYEKLIAGVALLFKAIWNFINNAGFFYWLTWFPFVMALGFAAASTSPLWAPIIVGITLTLTVAYTVWNAIHEGISLGKSKAEIQQEREARQNQAEDERVITKLRYRYFMKEDHRLNDQYLRRVTKKAEKVRVDKPAVEAKARDILHREKEDVQKMRLTKYLMQDSDALAGLAIARDVVNAIIMMSFAFWISSATLFAAGTLIPGALAVLSPVLAVLDNSVIAGALGLVLAAVYAALKKAETATAQQAYERKTHEILCQQYGESDKTVGEVFEKSEQRVDFKKAQAEWLRLEVLMKVESSAAQTIVDRFKHDQDEEVFNGNAESEVYLDYYKKLKAERVNLEKQLRRAGKCPSDNELVSKYDLDKINVYNHEYTEKLRHKPGVWTRVKKFCGRAFTFVAGMQTGSLLARSLFLAGCIFGGVIAGFTGSLPIYLAIAGTLALAYGSICLAQYVIERKRAHREKFLNNMDENISYLKKKEKELDLLIPHLAGQAEVKLPGKEVKVVNDDKPKPMSTNGHSQKKKPLENWTEAEFLTFSSSSSRSSSQVKLDASINDDKEASVTLEQSLSSSIV